MNQPLIFTERRLVPRLMDMILTLVAWIGFSYLIYNGLITALAHSPFMGLRPFFTTLNTVTFYMLVALANGLLLIGWAKYNQHRFRVERRNRRPGLEKTELAASLHITDRVAYDLSQGRVLTVYHHENGEIERVEVSNGVLDNLLPPPNATDMLHGELSAETQKVIV
ncbi:poly-beta-1,6-N-acetyl-D-glucosamine biosynthesis protein PgaD [Enterobacteriaceae bacterium H20N1]|uniref:Poly-beta-1,6-N-acetyl-D-glucosamine biosynthesis protein PgaD n=1 Tax=Dryocola boscaweniae TaxID=2925397 RepID=A0A9X2WAC9_9ENTR|nr:poly-beta-1,6-N-acetyl-D-glucosamine biosynthesis protein PgaD [Dryocola boscaweniae]MCT4703845.1 poly-beta-1,6-N-acetyl-D-glucosamine biosynthesis protein PgaD [Dryocola boscaweniae]MCT4717022.1 poly-beta-1,6-N-acetyl-D-glucosamine biosynthesis protein PgaD [Dryocola boscaweniae]MCT4721013.1 poly-beta-1,6-N-acetyl-D-glucosamine biosynthesis protein PgaD [Dryocola boscaweniae]